MPQYVESQTNRILKEFPVKRGLNGKSLILLLNLSRFYIGRIVNQHTLHDSLHQITVISAVPVFQRLPKTKNELLPSFLHSLCHGNQTNELTPVSFRILSFGAFGQT